MLALDLGVFHRKEHEVSTKEALIWFFVWIGLALVFNLGVWFYFGTVKAGEFLAGFLLEKALSVDNIFVFIVIFGYFRIPPVYQHRVLFWGILGALIMRAIFIFAGIALVNRFHWILLVFGVFLAFTGVKILMQKPEHEASDPEKNAIVRLFRKFVPMVSELHGPRFLITKEGKRYATPLLLVVVVVEATDVVFAIDSIPAVLAISHDSFIVYTSNIFAILGLRSLYFAISGIMDKFRFLKIGLGLVLVFVGFKMVIGYWEMKVPIGWSLGVIIALLGGSVLASMLIPTNRPKKDPVPPPAEGN